MRTTIGRDIIERVLTKFTGETGLTANVVQWEPDLPLTKAHMDALIEINGPQKKLRFVTEAKKVDRFETLHQVRAFWPKNETPQLLLAAPYITPKIAERCREMDMYFADTAGNIYLQAPGLHIYVAGKPKPPDFNVAETGRTVHPAGLRIVFALLCRPELLNAPYREIAMNAQVCLGTVGPVIKDLQKRKHLTPQFGTGQRKLLQPRRLLEEWVALYPIALRPKLNIKRFRTPQPKWATGLDLQPYKAQWGGEVAANRLLGYLEPQTATIYAAETPKQLIVDQRMRADPEGDVEILDVFWNFQPATPAPDLVPPILAYADLMATTDGRNHEAARMIYDRFIGPAFTNQL